MNDLVVKKSFFFIAGKITKNETLQLDKLLHSSSGSVSSESDLSSEDWSSFGNGNEFNSQHLAKQMQNSIYKSKSNQFKSEQALKDFVGILQSVSEKNIDSMDKKTLLLLFHIFF